MSAGLYEANAFAGVCPRVIINRLLAINGAKDRRVEETIKNKAFARHFLIFSHNNLYV